MPKKITEGKSNFFITVKKSKTKSGIPTSLRFSIAQDLRDLSLLESFVDFFLMWVCS